VRSAPPECCIVGADGQPWPCRSAWLVAFQSTPLERLDPTARDCCSAPRGTTLVAPDAVTALGR